MAIKMISSFGKKVGLPGYSSVSFGLTIECELTKMDEIESEANRAYRLLQESVDRELQNPGFVPPSDYGMEDSKSSDATAPGTITPIHDNGRWKCSDKQKDLILKLVDEHHLDKNEVDHLARQRFGKGVKQLSKLEASGLIDELLETYGGGRPAGNQGGNHRRDATAYSRNSRRDAA